MLQSWGHRVGHNLATEQQQESALWCLNCCPPGNCSRAGAHTWPCPSSTPISPGKSLTHRVCPWLLALQWQSKGNLQSLQVGTLYIAHGCGGGGWVRILECVWGRSRHVWVTFKHVTSFRDTHSAGAGLLAGLGSGRRLRALVVYQGT